MTKALLSILLIAPLAAAAGFRAGTARADITPPVPFWLSGYAARTHPAEHVRQRLWAKALALDDGHGGRLVVVTMDLVGLPPELSDEVARRCRGQFGLRRDQLWLNTSHTHSGPVVWPNLRTIFDFNDADQRKAEAYADGLTGTLVSVAGQALRNLAPGALRFGTGEAGFAINRRLDALRAKNPGRDFPAPVDRSVPVVEVRRADGSVPAVLFGYACHNTTLTGDFYEVSGDYAGYAQAAIEKNHPGAQAMFVILCGGDQNPSPRSKLALAEAHGDELAASVEKVLASGLQPVKPGIRTAFTTTLLPLVPRRREEFEAEARGNDVLRKRRAELMLATYVHGGPAQSVRYPVQAICFGRQLAIVTLGGEVVVDYSNRVKREYTNFPVVVSGYSNGIMSYIPSERVLGEGGYEADDAMAVYAQPGPYAPGVEERIMRSIHSVLKSVGVQPGRRAAE
ncbi:MAG: neutral/alkaline non-lysosomal ceramidase N-terminal domain-containing protein [Bryobacteraceae bacterium]|nr:neutral/alkaline non-lysosomal ceramidase N-terminal domain-containing protein [Bryobacteraceae bacterium]